MSRIAVIGGTGYALPDAPIPSLPETLRRSGRRRQLLTVSTGDLATNTDAAQGGRREYVGS